MLVSLATAEHVAQLTSRKLSADGIVNVFDSVIELEQFAEGRTRIGRFAAPPSITR